MSMLDWFLKMLDMRYEAKLRQEITVDLSDSSDYKYPPPSLYEVKQITEELGLNSHMIMSIKEDIGEWYDDDYKGPAPKHVRAWIYKNDKC